MASNPIKRRARQSFFLGFLIALVIMAVVVMFLFTRINTLNEENKKLSKKGPKINVYTVNRDIEEGEVITVEDLQSEIMELSAESKSIDVSNYLDPSMFYGIDEETGEEFEISYTSKVQINFGSVVTLSMIQEGGISNDERLMEYNMIVLPSQLKNGDYVDIRLRLANGTETVVLPKKKIEQCNATSIWMRMKEIEILTMNSAIVDAYLVDGSQLRATVYTNPLMQEANEANYPVNDEVLVAITYNSNILVEARNALLQKWSVTSDSAAGASDLRVKRREIDSYVTDTQDEKATKIEEEYTQEAADINTARGEYVSALEGTGIVGTTY